MDKEEFRELVTTLLERPVAFHASLARVSGSVTAGLFLSQLFYWTGRGSHKDGWIYKDWREWHKETCLTQDEQRGARKALRDKGLIDESDVRALGIDKFRSTLAFRINFEKLKTTLLPEDLNSADENVRGGEMPPRSDDKPSPQCGSDQAGNKKSTLQSTEISQETSSKSSSNAAAPKLGRKPKRGDEVVLHGVEVWTDSDAVRLETLVATHGANRVEQVAADLIPAKGHAAPYISQLISAFQEISAAEANATASIRKANEEELKRLAIAEKSRQLDSLLTQIIQRGESARRELVECIVGIDLSKATLRNAVEDFISVGTPPPRGLLLSALRNAAEQL